MAGPTPTCGDQEGVSRIAILGANIKPRNQRSTDEGYKCEHNQENLSGTNPPRSIQRVVADVPSLLVYEVSDISACVTDLTA